jgi:hypothetical protein
MWLRAWADRLMPSTTGSRANSFLPLRLLLNSSPSSSDRPTLTATEHTVVGSLTTTHQDDHRRRSAGSDGRWCRDSRPRCPQSDPQRPVDVGVEGMAVGVGDRKPRFAPDPLNDRLYHPPTKLWPARCCSQAAPWGSCQSLTAPPDRRSHYQRWSGLGISPTRPRSPWISLGAPAPPAGCSTAATPNLPTHAGLVARLDEDQRPGAQRADLSPAPADPLNRHAAATGPAYCHRPQGNG